MEEHLINKRLEVLKNIKPMCEAFKTQLFNWIKRYWIKRKVEVKESE